MRLMLAAHLPQFFGPSCLGVQLGECAPAVRNDYMYLSMLPSYGFLFKRFNLFSAFLSSSLR